MAQETPMPSVSSPKPTDPEMAPPLRRSRPTRLRDWLHANAVFFEVAGGIIIALATVAIAYQANRISTQQTDLLSRQTSLMDLAYQPALVVYAEQIAPDGRGRPSQSVITVSSYNAAVGEITTHFSTYIPVCRTANPPSRETSYNLVSPLQKDMVNCRMFFLSGFYDHVEYTPASTGEVARISSLKDPRGNLGGYFALSDNLAASPLPDGTYIAFGPMVTLLTIDFTGVKQSTELHFLVGMSGPGVTTTIQFPNTDAFTWNDGGTSWNFPVGQGDLVEVDWIGLDSETLGTLRPSETPIVSFPTAEYGQDIVDLAMRYLGYPYVSGTRGAASFDASGFTYWVIINTLGIDIGRSPSSQFESGVSVAYDDLQPGDLVFFENTYTAGLSHVGIYIGNNQFIHAINEAMGVGISDITSNYYSSRYYGARRLDVTATASPVAVVTP